MKLDAKSVVRVLGANEEEGRAVVTLDPPALDPDRRRERGAGGVGQGDEEPLLARRQWDQCDDRAFVLIVRQTRDPAMKQGCRLALGRIPAVHDHPAGAEDRTAAQPNRPEIIARLLDGPPAAAVRRHRAKPVGEQPGDSPDRSSDPVGGLGRKHAPLGRARKALQAAREDRPPIIELDGFEPLFTAPAVHIGHRP